MDSCERPGTSHRHFIYGCWKQALCVSVDGLVNIKPKLFKEISHVSLGLASAGVLFKELSSLCLPGSACLTRSSGHQRVAAQRG